MLEKMRFTDRCTGCKMCADVCPVSAISFEEDNGGFWYPKVDSDKCIECGLCEKKCPNLNNYKSIKQEPKVYAAWTRDTKTRLNCTSGGICYELSKYVIEQGGYVAGVAYADDFKSARYILVHDMEGLTKITQTKYFQADTNGIYGKIKEQLDKSNIVLFVGTPCYNAALHSFLGKEYNNLIQCDFVCRGNPSPRVHRLHIEYREKMYGGKIVVAHSKNKRKGWSCFGTYFKFDNGKEFYKDRYHNPTTIMFIGKNMNIRDSCFSCHYRTIPRVADITVGDFWGITGVEKQDYFNGCSLLMLNSEKGELLFEKVKGSLKYIERTLGDVAKGNPALYYNPVKSDKIGQFREDINELPFGQVLKKYVNKKDIGQKKVRHGLRKIMNLIRKIHKIDLIKLIYYNFFCGRIERKKGKYIIPCKGSCIDIEKGAKVYIGDNFILNTLRVKGSKAECYLKVQNGGQLTITGRVRLAYNSTLHVNRGGCLKIGQMATNANCNIQCSNTITIGHDVMIGRDVTIYDSDYHKTGVNDKKSTVTIGNHVWLCSGSMIMKGAKIGDGAIIGARSFIAGRVKTGAMTSPMPSKVIMENTEWNK